MSTTNSRSPCTLPLSAAIHVAAPSSSSSNQFNPVLGLQRQSTPPPVPLPSLLTPPGSPLFTGQLQRRRKRREGEGGEGREEIRKRAQGGKKKEKMGREEGKEEGAG